MAQRILFAGPESITVIKVYDSDGNPTLGNAASETPVRYYADFPDDTFPAGGYEVELYAGTIPAMFDTLTIAEGDTEFKTDGRKSSSASVDLSPVTDALAVIQATLAGGGTIEVRSDRVEGQKIRLIIGDDDVGPEVVVLSVSDPGGAVHAKIQAADSVLFGAGRPGQADEIIGTVTSTNSEDTTVVEVSIPSENKTGPASAKYAWHIKGVTGGRENVWITGPLVLCEEKRTVLE